VGVQPLTAPFRLNPDERYLHLAAVGLQRRRRLADLSKALHPPLLGRDAIGMTPVQRLRRVRVQRISVMLATTKLSST
jgi:hypothetical protein